LLPGHFIFDVNVPSVTGFLLGVGLVACGNIGYVKSDFIGEPDIIFERYCTCGVIGDVRYVSYNFSLGGPVILGPVPFYYFIIIGYAEKCLFIHRIYSFVGIHYVGF
jgi:hypothetical protein